MIIGYAGAHRTGKTTLCDAMEKELDDVPFVRTSMSATLKALGVDPQKDMLFADRLQVQSHLMTALEVMILRAEETHKLCLMDRTPLDILAYTYSEVLRETMSTPRLNVMFQVLQTKAFDLLNKHYHTIIIVPGGIPLVSDPDKAPANRIYQEHISSLMRGLIYMPGMRVPAWFIQPDCLTVPARVAASVSLLETIIKERHSNVFAGRFQQPSTRIQ